MHTLPSLGSQLPVVGLDWKSAGSWGPNIEVTVTWYCWLCDFHCCGACEPVLLEAVWWLESLRVESAGGFSSLGVFWAILPQEPFDSEGDGLGCDNNCACGTGLRQYLQDAPPLLPCPCHFHLTQMLPVLAALIWTPFECEKQRTLQ